MILKCSSCDATMVYKQGDGEEFTVYHSCTPARVRDSLKELRKLAWPWIPARQGQISFEEWSELVSRITSEESLHSHKWTGLQRGGDPTDAGSTEYVRYCEVCGIEDTCEDPLPPCTKAEVCETCGYPKDHKGFHSIPGTNRELCRH